MRGWVLGDCSFHRLEIIRGYNFQIFDLPGTHSTGRERERREREELKESAVNFPTSDQRTPIRDNSVRERKKEWEQRTGTKGRV